MKKGFTIIETSLVVAISGLLAVGLMIGWSRNINIQRYNDSVETFKSDIQAVFDAVQNQTNSREKIKCEYADMGSLKAVHDSNGVERGASDCILFGKAIIFSNNLYQALQSKFVEYDLIGIDKDYSEYSDNIKALQDSRFSVIPNSAVEHSLEWGSKMKMATRNKINGWDFSHKFFHDEFESRYMRGIIIIRSPIDGSLLTFGMTRVFTDKWYIEATNTSNLWRYDFISSKNILNSTDRTVRICVTSANNVYGNLNRVVSMGSSGVSILPANGKGSMYCGIKEGKDFDTDIFFEGKPII